MATRQKDKDIINFYKKLKKRYPKDAVVLSREHKILEHLVFAIFLENATFDQACSSFNRMERYFIDWNEVRVSKANEIASVIGNVPNALKVGERLRRLLQWIFDKTFKFDLEDTRARGVEETLGFLKTVPFSTRFMNEYASLIGFGSPVFPMDEGVLRVFRLLGWVEVRDDQEVVPCVEGVFDEKDLLGFFFAAHELGCELMDESTQKSAIKFLATVDSSATKRSFAPLVESALPTDPNEIAKLFAKRERRPKNVSASAMMNEMFGDETMDSDDIDESDDFEKNGEDGGYDPYGGEDSGEFGGSESFGGGRGAQESAYSSGKRAETTLSKDGASYSESVGDDEGTKVERGVKSRKRARDAGETSGASRKSVKVGGARAAKVETVDVEAEDVVVLRSSDEQKSKEKKPVVKKSSKSENLENVDVAKASDRSEDVGEVKKSEVKKSVRTSKSKKTVDESELDAEKPEKATEKKSASSEKKSSGDVDRDKKTSSKTPKEAESKSRSAKSSSLSESVAKNRSRMKEKEQAAVKEVSVKPKRKRESEASRGEPPASGAKKR